MQDQLLDWAVVVLPTLLSLLGVLVTLEPWDRKHKSKWRWGLVVFGVAVSSLTYWQQYRQRSKAAGQTNEFRFEVINQEKNAVARFDSLSDSLKNLLNNRPAPPNISPHLAGPKPIPSTPTAEEIAALVDKKLKETQPRPTPLSTPTLNSTPTPNPCRGDKLNECTDDGLIKWSEPLGKTIDALFDREMKELDAITQTKTKDARKNLQAYFEAQERAATGYVNCCAEDVIRFYNELAMRLGGGKHNKEVDQWTRNLELPKKSSQYQEAVLSTGSHLINISKDVVISALELTRKK